MSMKGIDISNWQNGINLEAVPADFVIMKATEGTNYISPDFDRQYAQAKKAGRYLGVYHYANGGDAKKEADFFLNKVKNCIGEAILVLDWEGQNNPRFGKKDLNWCKTWCDYVYSKTGAKPLVYTSRNFMKNLEGIGDYGLWIAQYANNKFTGYQDTPWNEKAYSCVIRQYSSCGRLPGYRGNLDLNKFYGDSAAWKEYAKSDNKKPSTISGTTLELAVAVMKGKYGVGNARKNALGSRYDEVQSFINHISRASVKTLAQETINGRYGNGETRKTVLGSKYEAVQTEVNKIIKAK